MTVLAWTIKMSEQTYQNWQRLHRKTVHGEALTEFEIELYDAGRNQLDADERFDADIERLQELREKRVQADLERRTLRERQSELDSHISELESRMDARTRQLLGIRNFD